MSKYMKKNERKNKKKISKSLKESSDMVFVGNLVGSRKIIRETNDFIQGLYVQSEDFKKLSRHSNTIVEHEVNKALSLYSRDIADLLDAQFDRYRIV